MAAGTAEAHRQGRLVARPVGAPAAPQASGRRRIRIHAREAELFLPAPGAAPVPLLVMLHGAGGRPESMLGLALQPAQRLGFAVLAPKSLGPTWDVLQGGFGPDVGFIDEALDEVFGSAAIDPGRIGVAGFSDGASYALSLGLLNGGLASDVLAFSPGFAAARRPEGRPRVFISHGVDDRVLPIDRCGRLLARQLAAAGYDVLYREFDGGHVVPPELRDEAIARFLAPRAA